MEVVDYLVVRMERSFEEALRLVNLLDKEALAEKNRITIPLASRVLKK
jgi:chromosomal replication initiation ATPase DnaA